MMTHVVYFRFGGIASSFHQLVDKIIFVDEHNEIKQSSNEHRLNRRNTSTRRLEKERRSRSAIKSLLKKLDIKSFLLRQRWPRMGNHRSLRCNIKPEALSMPSCASSSGTINPVPRRKRRSNKALLHPVNKQDPRDFLVYN